ncbi:hypothetical protein E2C01_050315 [Portunus trituberculatus]|uniref:Uncharacterized protein n=1 Tax=Portunus trituberculatus TaxID=210409 RepID=A0A5B7GGZ2_PORTR|nr:hypothetical protein [Portunus trituberculatus]
MACEQCGRWKLMVKTLYCPPLPLSLLDARQATNTPNNTHTFVTHVSILWRDKELDREREKDHTIHETIRRELATWQEEAGVKMTRNRVMV